MAASPIESDKNFSDVVAHELRDYWEKDHSCNLIRFNGKHWLIKSKLQSPAEKNLDFLAYLLGKGWLNIPEVRLLSANEFQAIYDRMKIIWDGRASEQNTYLIRVAQDYSKKELPIKNLDMAMASEIVFSAWIGRRDAHSSNRAFISRVPMFFDFGTGFGAEKEDFFRSGQDAGYTANWRFFCVESGKKTIDLAVLRRSEFAKGLAAIPIISKDHFMRGIRLTIDRIGGISRERIHESAKMARLPDQRCEEITDLLQNSSAKLEENVAKILKILNSDNF